MNAWITGGAPGPWEVILILFVVLLLFGTKKLPELSRSIGKSLGEFKKGKEEGEKSLAESKTVEKKLDEKDKETKADGSGKTA